MTTLYRQCKLVKENTETTSYIPEKFAVVDNILKLKDENGVWSNGWRVVFAGDLTEAPDYRKAIRTHRNRTGDDLPK